MKILLSALGLLLCIIGVIILISLNRYIKQHSNEKLEAHKSFIFPRFIVIAALVIVGAMQVPNINLFGNNF